MESLPFEIRAQPDDTTCGPTCLHAVYRYWSDTMSLRELLGEIPSLPEGGTLCVHLANHALGRGYRATIVTWNLQIFDPTWFRAGAPPIAERLAAQSRAKSDPRLLAATDAYQTFLGLGGALLFEDLTPALLRRNLKRGIPIVTGLSATYLYRESRERGLNQVPDDVAGDPVGHFVVMTGYAPDDQSVYVSDPLHTNPHSRLSGSHTYEVPIHRVIGAVYLGVLTHDANLLLIEPRTRSTPARDADDRRR